MTEKLWHAGMSGVLFRDNERHVYVATFPGRDIGPVESNTYEACAELWRQVAEQEASK